MKKKKTLIAIIAVLLVVVVGATFAYYTSNTSFENVFNAGKYKVTLTEVFESPDNWVPGETVPKTVTAKNEGTVPAAVRISYTEQWLQEIEGVETDITSQVSPNPAIINFANQDDWTLSNGKYYYNYILEPTNETSSFISGVTLNPNLNSVTCTGEENTKTCEAQNKASGAKYKLTFTIETVQADQYQNIWQTNVEITEKSAITYLSRQVEGQITPGDVIGIGETEDFYVISSDSNKTVLLAKYNLLVGSIIEDWGDPTEELDPSTTPGYGLQSVNATSPYGNNSNKNGYAVEFSSDGYWMDKDTLKVQYTDNNRIYSDIDNIYKYIKFRLRSDNSITYPYVYDSNASIYQYIGGENGYVDKLKAMGAPSTITGRLLSYEEAMDNINLQVNNESIIICSLGYWLGSSSGHYYNAYEYQGVNYVDEYGWVWAVFPHQTEFRDVLYNSLGDWYGVRPVIEIPTSELQ